MSLKRKTAFFYILCAAAAVMALWGFIRVLQAPDVLEYVIDYAHAPQIRTDDEGHTQNELLEAFDDLRESYRTESVSIHVLKDSLALSGERDRTDTVTMIGAGRGYFDVYHTRLMFGRYFDDTEISKGGDCVILNESAAFTLFGVRDAVDRTVSIGDEEYRVVGVVRKDMDFLDSQSGVVYLPIAKVRSGDIQTVVVSMKGNGGLAVFQSTAESAMGTGGSAYSLPKEKMRARAPLRFLWIFFALTRIPAVVRAINRKTRELAADLKERRRQVYFDRLFPRAVLFVLWCVILYGAVIACLYLIVRSGFAYAEVFTEFMPEDPTDWNSILKVARSIHARLGQWLSASTPAVRSVEGYGRLCGAGAILFLLAWALPERARKEGA